MIREEATMADEKKIRIRMTVDFPPESAARLRRLKEYLEATSYIDVIRKALMLLEVCVGVIREGGSIVKIDKNGKQTGIGVPTP